MHRPLALVLLLVAVSPAAASQGLAIHASCAAELAAHATHVRTLRDAIAHEIKPQPEGYSIDISLVHLDATLVGSEVEVRAEVRAILSDERGRVKELATSKTVARGLSRDRSLISRDAIEEAARGVAKKLER